MPNAAVPDTDPAPWPGQADSLPGLMAMNDVAYHSGSLRRRLGTRFPTGFLSAPQTPGAQQPQREQTQRCSPAHVHPVLAIERPRVTLGVLSRRVPLAPFRSAPTGAAPEHRVALREEAKTVSEKVAAQHR
ncbi:hypothetical protein [Streptomyces sp. F001]|uniref:hypothetical protein n=1 Tax=Streptomyces sp. F001 TaxID=1510026 RepID=UPI0013EE6E73|nr:hypothetical protein [Streptomyces sp. F001]